MPAGQEDFVSVDEIDARIKALDDPDAPKPEPPGAAVVVVKEGDAIGTFTAAVKLAIVTDAEPNAWVTQVQDGVPQHLSAC